MLDGKTNREIELHYPPSPMLFVAASSLPSLCLNVSLLWEKLQPFGEMQKASSYGLNLGTGYLGPWETKCTINLYICTLRSFLVDVFGRWPLEQGAFNYTQIDFNESSMTFVVRAPFCTAPALCLWHLAKVIMMHWQQLTTLVMMLDVG